MLNLIDWMRATAEWMHQDRPDLFESPEAALNDLGGWMEVCRSNRQITTFSTGGFQLVHSVNELDGEEEWEFSKIISSCVIFAPEGECAVSGWTHDSQTINTGVNLPSAADQIDP